MKKQKINCFKCVYFFTTWDKTFPRGCRAMDFKTKKMPSALVFESTGLECTMFKPKKKPAAS